MPAIIFTQADFDNLELVRQLVFRRLKEGSWNQLYDPWEDRTVSQIVVFDASHLRNRFIVMVVEVMWQLIVQGVVTPGMNAANPALPWFRVTDYGRTVLEAERFVPHDPTGYLDEVRTVAQSATGDAALQYLEEALRCFTAGCNVAAVMMLGIAAEAAFLGLCAVIASTLGDGEIRREFEQLRWVKQKHRWVVDKYQSIPNDQRRSLPESLDVTLTSLADLIRRQRNDIGHPAEEIPTIDREQAFVYFKLFPTFISDVEALASYWEENGI